jgi:hypothetical protein
MAGVVMADRIFTMAEFVIGVIRDDLIPVEKLDEFEEFHACELYGGYGVFQGIDQEKRFEAIRQLLGVLGGYRTTVVYGAVNLDELHNKVYASADPLDICFRLCVDNIQGWMYDRIWKQAKAKNNSAEITGGKLLMGGYLEELIILIVDDCEPKIKNILLKSFRTLRPRKPEKKPSGPLFHFHDDMYFGDSRYSLGIQLADLCSYFIARHLEGDTEIEGFYKMIEPYIEHSKIEPGPDQPPPDYIRLADGKLSG